MAGAAQPVSAISQPDWDTLLSKHCFALIVALLITQGVAGAWPTVHPTGTTLYNPQAAYPGYVLFAPLSIPIGMSQEAAAKGATIFLVNMRGEVVHRWQVPFYPLQARLLKNGNLLVTGQINKGWRNRPGFGKLWMGGATGKIVELTWEGKTVFSHEDLNMHHAAAKLPNGHYLYPAWERIPAAQQKKVRGGIKGTEFPGGVMFNDYLVEVDARGKTVWTWHANRHLDPQVDIIGAIYKREEWSHFNSLAMMSDGNILLTSRSLDSVMIIDKPSGKVIFRWGSTAYLDKATRSLESTTGPMRLGGPHGAVEIPANAPGAGHILCYDNGLYKAVSRAVEIDPASGRLIWESSNRGVGRGHFADIMGNAERLPNGNTLFCEGANGRFFQTNPSGQIAWEYINPYVPSPALHGSVFRIHQYAQDYCPQFKMLPPARGAAVLPSLKAPNDQSQARSPAAEPAHEHDDNALPNILGAAVISAIVAASVAFQLGRRSTHV